MGNNTKSEEGTSPSEAISTEAMNVELWKKRYEEELTLVSKLYIHNLIENGLIVEITNHIIDNVNFEVVADKSEAEKLVLEEAKSYISKTYYDTGLFERQSMAVGIIDIDESQHIFSLAVLLLPSAYEDLYTDE